MFTKRNIKRRDCYKKSLSVSDMGKFRLSRNVTTFPLEFSHNKKANSIKAINTYDTKIKEMQNNFINKMNCEEAV